MEKSLYIKVLNIICDYITSATGQIDNSIIMEKRVYFRVLNIIICDYCRFENFRVICILGF